jgi:hypothetical protein
MNLTRRRCLVCEWEGDVFEPPFTDDIGPPCSNCGAPTERLQILRAGIVPKSPHAVALGRLGGLRGGPARAEALTPERRQEIARRAAEARWKSTTRNSSATARLPHKATSGVSPRKTAPPPLVMPSALLERTVRRYYQLFNERRLDEAVKLVDPAASFYYVPTGQRMVGREAYRTLSAAWLTALDAARIEITSLRRVNDQTVRVEVVGRGLHTGPLVLGEALAVPPTGRPVALVFYETLKVRNGLIVSVQFDFDLDTLRQRLAGMAEEAPQD